MQVSGKVIVVSGAGNGVGRAVTLEALRRGARVAAVDISAAGLDETTALAAAGDRLATFQLDITDREAVAALPARVTDRFGVVDGLIHLAAIIQPFERVKDLDDAAIERVFSVNWWGTLYLSRAFLPVLLGRPEAHIVNTSSMGGFIPVPGQTIYGASKAAVKLLTEALHAECRGTPVRVTVAIPGGMATNMAANSGVTVAVDPARAAEMSRQLTTPEAAAAAILDAMERNAYRVLIGRDARLMDILYRINPSGAAAFIARQMRGLLGGTSGGAGPATSADRDPAERGILRLFYRNWRPTRLGRLANRFTAWWASTGLPPSIQQTLEVRGRTTGAIRSTPVVIATVDGQRHLVSMLGPDSDWVKNVLAADGKAVLRHGSREPVRLVPVPPDQRAPVLREYVRVATSGRRHLPVPPGAPLEEFAAIADRYPVFRIEPR